MKVQRQRSSDNTVAPVRAGGHEKASYCSAVDQQVRGTARPGSS